MADFEQKLQLLAERGTPVGPEELIERVEHELAGHPLVVVRPQRKGHSMTKTDEVAGAKPPSPRRGAAWAIAAFVAVLAVGGLFFAFGGGDEVADEPPPAPTTTTTSPPTTTTLPPTTTTLPPTTTTTSPDAAAAEEDVALVEAAIAAWYDNDFEMVVQLLEIPGGPDWDADDVQNQMAYDDAVSSRTEQFSCTVPELQGGVFTCRYVLLNTITDAMGLGQDDLEAEDIEELAVVDGRVTNWFFHDQSFINEPFMEFLEETGEVEAAAAYEGCQEAPLNADCAQIQLEHLDGWVTWFGENF